MREIAKALASFIPTRWTEGIANYAVMREHPWLLPSEYVVRDKRAYFARVNAILGGPAIKLTFLEFGVLDGDSIRFWATLNTNADSRFVGFDSFEGIPAAWRGREAGYFDRGGTVPEIPDARVRLVKGWFNRTLPNELAGVLGDASDTTLLVHIDSDLHASALYCLSVLGSRLPSFHVMFDEYGAGEARALRDVVAAYGAEFTPLLGFKRTAGAALPTRVFGRLDLPSSRPS